MTEWDDRLTAWWVGEVESDPAYRDQVLPMTLDLLGPVAGSSYLDLGCGDGRVMAAIEAAGGRAVGVDASHQLTAKAQRAGAAVVGRIPDLGFIQSAVFDGIVIVLVLEHLDQIEPVFDEVARVTRDGGVLVVVVNHPLLTAPGSGPFVDPDDGEVLWRWGAYLGEGHTDEPAGDGEVRFHHRTMAHLLTTAATAGWSLQRVVEAGYQDDLAEDPLRRAQRDVPRLLGVRWVRSP